MAPAGAVIGPLSNEALPQIFAGGELGQDPFGTGSVVVGLVGLIVVGGAVVAVGGALVVVGGLVVGAGAVVTGAVVVGGAVVGAGAVVVGAEVAVAVGVAVGVGVMPLLATVKSPWRLEVLPSDQVSTTLMRCKPSASFVVSYGKAVPLLAVPAKSKGALVSVLTGGPVREELSR